MTVRMIEENMLEFDVVTAVWYMVLFGGWGDRGGGRGRERKVGIYLSDIKSATRCILEDY